MHILQFLKVKFVKIKKIYETTILWIRKYHTKFQGDISTNNIAIADQRF